MSSPKSILALLLVALALSACAGGKQKPPRCKGDFERINDPKHYPSPDARS